MGMSRHIHLFIDETGGAYSPDFAGPPKTIWRTTEDRESARVHVRFAAASCASFREGVTRLQAWLSRQKSACDGAVRELRSSGSRGVGPKIANCVMLFAYERLRAFPIDVWIERVLRQHYFSHRKKMTAQRLRQFSETYFGEHGGYAQQYLFHHARSGARGDRAIGVNRPYLGRNERR